MDFNNVTTITNSRFLGHVPEVGPDAKDKVTGAGDEQDENSKVGKIVISSYQLC